MKVAQFCATFFLAMSIGASLADTQLAERWEKFITTGDAWSYNFIQSELLHCDPTLPCAKQVLPSEDQLMSLLGLVENANHDAIHITFLLRPFLDGGDLEDAYVALADTSELVAEFFLSELNNDSVPAVVRTGLVQMLPLDTSDDFAKKKEIVERRIQALSSVVRPDLGAVRDKAIADLRDLKLKLDEVQKRSNSDFPAH